MYLFTFQLSYESQFAYKQDLRIEVITKASSIAKEWDILLAEEQSKELQQFNIYKMHSNFNLQF